MQLALSTDIVELTAEINIWKQQAGQAVFEIGKRLKHVKEMDLVHGQWIPWLESVDIKPRTAQAMMRAYEQFGNTQHATHLPTGKIFDLLSLPESVDREEFLSKPQVIPSSGEEKMALEMSREELREVRRSLQVAEQATEIARKQSERYYKELQERPVVEKTVPMPHDKIKIQMLEKQLSDSENAVNVYKRKANLNEEEAKKFAEMKKQMGFLNQEKNDIQRQIESATALSGLSVKIDNFLKTELSPIRYSRALERLDSEVAVKNLTEIIQSVEQWCEDMRRYIPTNNRVIVEVAI